MTKNHVLRISGFIILTGTLFAAPFPASAQGLTSAGPGMLVNSIQGNVISSLQQYWTKIQTAFHAASGTGQQNLSSQAGAQQMQTNVDNNRNNLNISSQHRLAEQHQMPSSYSPCTVAAASAAQVKAAAKWKEAQAQEDATGRGAVNESGWDTQRRPGVINRCPTGLERACKQASLGYHLASDAEPESGSKPGVNLVSLTSGIGTKKDSHASRDLILADSSSGGGTSGAEYSMDSVCAQTTLVMPSSYQSSASTPVTGTDAWSLAKRYCESLKMRMTTPSGAGTNGYELPWYADQIARGSAAYSACNHELMLRTVFSSASYSQAQKDLDDAAKKQSDANLADPPSGSVSKLGLLERASCSGSSENWQHNGRTPMLASDIPANDQANMQKCTEFQSTKEDSCRANITAAIKITQDAEQAVSERENGNLEYLKRTELEEQMKKQTALLNDTLQKLTNQMQQLQAAIKSPDSKVPVSYTHKISTQVEN